MSKLWMPSFWTPRKAGMRGVPLIEGPSPFGFQGWITLTLRDAETGRVKKILSFPNMLTNLFFEGSVGWLAESTNTTTARTATVPWGSGIFFAAGSGNTAPAANETTLVSELAGGRTSTVLAGGLTSFVAGTPDYTRVQAIKQFSISQAVGAIREVGAFSASSGSNMIARALLRDGAGNPTTLNKSNTETLDVLWELRVQPIQGDIADAFTLGGVPYTLTYRAANLGLTQGLGAAAEGLQFGGGGAGVFNRQAAGLVSRTTQPVNGQPTPDSISPQALPGGGLLYRDIRFRFAASTPAVSGLGRASVNGAGTSGIHHTFQIGFVPDLAAGQFVTLRVQCTRL